MAKGEAPVPLILMEFLVTGFTFPPHRQSSSAPGFTSECPKIPGLSQGRFSLISVRLCCRAILDILKVFFQLPVAPNDRPMELFGLEETLKLTSFHTEVFYYYQDVFLLNIRVP